MPCANDNFVIHFMHAQIARTHGVYAMSVSDVRCPLSDESDFPMSDVLCPNADHDDDDRRADNDDYPDGNDDGLDACAITRR